MRALLQFASAFLILSLSSFTSVSAWTGPTASAPGNNAAAPINVSTVSQVKNGNIGVNGLSVFGNSLLYGSGSGGNAYLNFGTTTGSVGYGIYDNGGTLNFKNSGGSWQTLQAVVSGLVGGGSQWTASGNNIYNSNTGNVGLGTASPGYELDVNGTVHAGGTLTATAGLNETGRVNITGANNGDWTEVINWGPGSVNNYGILVGTSAGKYSQFQNAEGYWVMLANSSWGVYTNGNIYASGYFQGYNSFGGIFDTIWDTGACNGANPFTGGCSCPGFAPNASMFGIGYHGSGYEYMYQCY